MSAKLIDAMLAQQLATNQAMMRRFSANAGLRLPPMPERQPKGVTTQMPSDITQVVQQQALHPTRQTRSGGHTRPRRQISVEEQWYNPFGRTTYQGRVTIPAAFPLAPAMVEVESLNMPKKRVVPTLKDEEVPIDWTDSPDKQEVIWKRDRTSVLLRRVFYVSWFVGLLKASIVAKNKIHATEETSEETILFEILIKEIIYTIHRIYLDKHSEMFRLLNEIIRTPLDLTVSISEASNDEPFSPALEETVYLLENITFQITYIQPVTGVLGTNYRSYLISLIKDGQLFPLNEFWQIERRWLQFDYTGRTINSGMHQSTLLIMMVFFARALVWTLLMHPDEYGLANIHPGLSPISRRNLKFLASLFLFIYRRAIIPRDTERIPMPPKEIAHLLMTDDELKPLVERIENSLFYCDGLLREWSTAYVKRLRQAEKKK